MTDKKKLTPRTLLIPKGNTGELALSRTRDMLDLTERLLKGAPELKMPGRSEPAGGPYGKEYRDAITGMEFVWVPGGRFEMGDVLGDAENDNWMKQALPVHTVALDGFYLGRYAVTQGEWVQIMGNNPSWFKKGDRYPVENVGWSAAREFLACLNKKSGKNYTLPSEAQWEYAAREGGKAVRFGTGQNTIGPDEANFNGSDAYVKFYSRGGVYRRETVPVDSFAPNALGLYQMSGNVWEWCRDAWHDSYEGAPCDGFSWETGQENADRVVRGGSWYLNPGWIQAAFRSKAGNQDGFQGFRVVLPAHA